jgi:rhamnogalacturonyl hydrolase YesR
MCAQGFEALNVESAIRMAETVIAETALEKGQEPTRYNYWMYQNYMIGEGIKAMGEALGRPDFSAYRDQQAMYFCDAHKKIKDRTTGWYLKPKALWQSGLVAVFVELQETSDRVEIARGISGYQNLLDTTHKVSDGTLARYKNGWKSKGIQIDDLYMASSYWARLSRQAGKAEYLEQTIEETLSYYQHLWNPETKLLHCLWLEKKPEVRIPHWGRGNGWFVMAITDLLGFVPENHPKRAELLKIYNNVMLGLMARQNADGLWHQVLDHPESYTETSCSGMFTYSLLRGAAKGWLPASARDAGLKGWDGLQTKLTENNQLKDVCVGTDMSEDVNYFFKRPRVTHDQHGIGPYLLAASEVIKLTKKDRSESDKLNIILIMADDLGYADLSCTGLADDVHTPNIDRIAKNGIRFTNAYVTAPICNASRIAIATGVYQQRQGQYWYRGPGLYDPTYRTIGETLKARGYKTGYVGKYHHGGNDAPNKRGFPLNHGYDTFYGFSGGTKHYLIHNRASEKKLYRAGPMYVEDELQDVEGFTTELFGEKGRHFVREHKDEPFHLFLSFNAVHHYINQLPEAYLKEKGLSRYPDFGEINGQRPVSC